MSSLDLSNIYAKLDRAYFHLDALNQAIDAWCKTYPAGLKSKSNPDGRIHSATFEVYREPDHLRFGVIIGDSAQNLRSALDHLVHAVARKQLSAANYKKVEWNLSCPLATSETAWDKAIASGWLGGISDDVVTEIRIRQPYQTHDTPKEAPLALLGWINNRDKHRLIHTAVAATVMGETKIDIKPGFPVDKVWRADIKPGPFEDGAEVFRLDLPEPRRERDVDVEVHFLQQILVKEAATRDDIRETLMRAGQFAQRIIVEVARVA
ncbi:MAG TPA: hypothetical protein VNE42_08200 [Acidimicrobiales bacterium]|nr:hypothetical protein [Acidimicrobiales bacterium]